MVGDRRIIHDPFVQDDGVLIHVSPDAGGQVFRRDDVLGFRLAAGEIGARLACSPA
jgi:hypothetical protein